MLQITEEGRATVATLEFAEEICLLMTILREDGESEEDIENMARLRIAMALAEIDGLMEQHTRSSEDIHELVGFMIEHANEIECAFDNCIDLLNRDYVASLRN